MDNSRANTIKRIKTGLVERTGRQWSVTGGRGTAYGWISITAPNARLVCSTECGPACTHYRGYMSADDRALLALALSVERVHNQGVSIASSNAHYTEYVDRAEGRTPSAIGTQYWD